MLGHLGVNVADLRAAGGRGRVRLFFYPSGCYPSAETSPYSRHQTGLQHLAFVVRSRTVVDEPR
jgi:hypothetical protein